MYFTPTGLWNTPNPGGVTSAAQKIPLATALVTMPEPETYAEYLWRERTESGGEVDKTTSEICASDVSNVLPANECRHVQSRMLKVFRGYQFVPNELCPKCGEKL